MTTTHTPGPWSWGNVDWQGWGGDADALDGPDDNVLYGVWHNDSTAGIGITSKANAALIAAAPDLLAALEHAVIRSHGHHPSSCDWCAAADKAIAKARGA